MSCSNKDRSNRLSLYFLVFFLMLSGIAPGVRADSGGQKVLLIGLDAADWSVIDPLIVSGRMPTLGFLKENGVWAQLRSIKPLLSPPLWTTIVTGKTRDKHGVKGFTVKDRDGKEVPLTGNFRVVKALWNILSGQGLSVGFINWMPTYPAEPVNGFMVSDYLRHFYPQIWLQKGNLAGTVESIDGIVYPDDLRPLVAGHPLPESRFLARLDLEKIHSYQLAGGRDPALKISFKDNLKILEHAARGDQLVEQVALRLCAYQDVDLFGVFFLGIDLVSHLFWHFAHPEEYKATPEMARDLGGIVDDYYSFTDEMVGNLLAAFSEDINIVIVSDHGYGGEGRNYHDPTGIVLLYGPAFASGVQLSQASVLDITPTVLFLLGLPTARDMDGQILYQAFSREFLSSHEPTWIDSYEETAKASSPPEPIRTILDQDTLERLRTLGYIE